MSKRWVWLGIMVLVAVDQFTKYWAATVLVPYQPIYILPFFDLVLAFNKGAAFSFLSTTGELARYFFPAFSLVLSVVLGVWLKRIAVEQRLQWMAVGLILAGAVGNLIDRALWGEVVDFILLHYHQWNWPVFNLADTFITLGGCCLAWDLYQKPSA